MNSPLSVKPSQLHLRLNFNSGCERRLIFLAEMESGHNFFFLLTSESLLKVMEAPPTRVTSGQPESKKRGKRDEEDKDQETRRERGAVKRR